MIFVIKKSFYSPPMFCFSTLAPFCPGHILVTEEFISQNICHVNLWKQRLIWYGQVKYWISTEHTSVLLWWVCTCSTTQLLFPKSKWPVFLFLNTPRTWSLSINGLSSVQLGGYRSFYFFKCKIAASALCDGDHGKFLNC